MKLSFSGSSPAQDDHALLLAAAMAMGNFTMCTTLHAGPKEDTQVHDSPNRLGLEDGMSCHRFRTDRWLA